MSDPTLNYYNARGTTAERTAFVPDPATPAAGPALGYVFYDTDDDTLYAWDGASWVAIGGASSGTVTNSGALTDHALIVGNGGVDVSALGSLGTTTTVLHGNAAGDPTFGPVDLAADVTGTLPATALPTATRTRAITLGIDGGGAAITTGIKADVYVPYAGTITAVTMLADQSGSIVVDIWKDTYANYPPTVADSITASAKPTISAATKSRDTTLTGWTTSVSAGDTLRFNVDSASAVRWLALTLTVTV